MELNFTLDKITEAAQKFVDLTSGYSGVMGVKDNITSPTFSIINQYTNRQGRIIYHMDLYRLKDEEEAIQAGVEDCLYSGNTCFVEWPEKAPGIFPDNTLHINITAIDMNTRKLKINL